MLHPVQSSEEKRPSQDLLIIKRSHSARVLLFNGWCASIFCSLGTRRSDKAWGTSCPHPRIITIIVIESEWRLVGKAVVNSNSTRSHCVLHCIPTKYFGFFLLIPFNAEHTLTEIILKWYPHNIKSANSGHTVLRIYTIVFPLVSGRGTAGLNESCLHHLTGTLMMPIWRQQKDWHVSRVIHWQSRWPAGEG